MGKNKKDLIQDNRKTLKKSEETELVEDSALRHRVAEAITDYFEISGFEVMQISDRHYRNRLINDDFTVLDVQIGYKVHHQLSGETRYRNIENYTLVLR